MALESRRQPEPSSADRAARGEPPAWMLQSSWIDAHDPRPRSAPVAVPRCCVATSLGHALHPVPTDVVIGSWTSATVLDVLGGAD